MKREVSLCLAALWALGGVACDEGGDAPGGSVSLTGGSVLPAADPDSDMDGVPDRFEGELDADADGTPAYLDPDETATNYPAGDAPLPGADAGAADAGSVPASDGGGQTAGDAGGTLDAGADAAGSGDAGPTDAAAQDSGPVSHPETGQLEGITEAHNVIRRMVDPDDPLPDLTWNETAAAYAQEWAEGLADDCQLVHSMGGPYGENLAKFPVSGNNTAEAIVNAWASEVDCWTYGTIDWPPSYPGTEECNAVCVAGLNSNGCGHYTQVVWRNSTSVGCGVARCNNGSYDIWACSYDPPGNYAQQYPY